MKDYLITEYRNVCERQNWYERQNYDSKQPFEFWGSPDLEKAIFEMIWEDFQRLWAEFLYYKRIFIGIDRRKNEVLFLDIIL